ncbi:hypothetical protein [Tenacibaculum aquimarinum]|uniref:hypothetical protein n=1 Tax=Tenacibaculum aquimarinum TaxID=2910675 RepID=UPI001F0ABFC3|nr:hypothetical protein [Tenacibaculum aquimarinum]MCH3881583.1 hypothetical protein [Tenacibaculum aquimarinum]
MKKILLTLTLLLTFNLSFGFDSNEIEINNENTLFDCFIENDSSNNYIFLESLNTYEEYINCMAVAGAAYDAVVAEGATVYEATSVVYVVYNACQALLMVADEL